MKAKWLVRTMKWLSLGAILLLLLAYASTRMSPLEYPYMSLFGLAFPVIFALNLLSLVFWIFLRKRFVWIVVLAMALGYNVLFDFVQWNFRDSVQKEEVFSVMSFNVRLFDLYNWIDGDDTKARIFSFLGEKQPDIVCFQEFYYTPNNTTYKTKKPIQALLSAGFVHEHYTHEKSGKQYFGGATFSRFPMVNKGVVPFESDQNNYCMYSDIVIESDTIRVYNAHLSSIRFQADDYAFIENAKSKRNWSDGLRIVSRLRKAFEKRTEQTMKVLESVQNSPYPVILCGDFNDTPASYCYQQIRTVLEDSFRDKGKGVSGTYNGFFPGLRIDYNLHSPGLKTAAYDRFPGDFSDHHPIMSSYYYPAE